MSEKRDRREESRLVLKVTGTETRIRVYMSATMRPINRWYGTLVDNKAKVYDDPTIKEYALEGNYEYRGIKCQPVFQVVKEHLKQYTPEKAAEVSGVPAETLRRIATEFVNAASIGSTINIDGHSFTAAARFSDYFPRRTGT